MWSHLYDSQSLEWDAKWFTDLISKVAEGPRFDRKLIIKIINYKLSSLELLQKEKLHDAEKAKKFKDARNSLRDFIKDCIAMANVARRRGLPTYIVFGVDDDWTPNPDGILWQATRDISHYEYEKCLSSADAFTKLQMEFIARDFTKYILQFIEPWPEFSYEFGWAEYKLSVYAFGYLVFYPSRNSLPYRPKMLKEGDIDSRKWYELLGLNSSVTWSRIGESNTKFEGDQISTLYAYSDIPFISSEEWLIYVNNLQEKLVNFQRLDPILSKEQVGFQTIYATDNISNNELNLYEELERFAYSETPNPTLFVIGHGGAGKSTAVRSLILQVTDNLRDSLQTNKKLDQPQKIIPIYVEFSHNTELISVQYIINKVTATLPKTGSDNYEQLAKIFTDRTLKFLIVLDAIDETSPINRSYSLQSIRGFIERYPNVKMVLVSRPYVFPDYELSSQRCLELRRLRTDQIENRVAASNLTDEIRFQLIKLIKSDEELRKLLSILGMLSICVEELVGVQYLSLGLILEKCIEGFLERDFAKLDENLRLIYHTDLCDLAEQAWDSFSFPVTRARDIKSYPHWISNGLLQKSGRYLVKFTSDYIAAYQLAKLIKIDPLFRQKNRHYIDNSQNQYQDIIHILANLEEASDISDSNLIWHHWIKNQSNPYLTLQIYTERQYDSVHDLSIFQKALTDLLGNVAPNSISSIRQIIQNLIMHTRNQEMIAILMSNLLHSSNSLIKSLLTSDEIVKLINDYTPMNPIAVCAVQIVDWSLGYPDDLIDLFQVGIDPQIQEIVLQNMIDFLIYVPDRLLKSINLLVVRADESIGDLAKELLSRTKEDINKLRQIESRRKQLAEQVMVALKEKSLAME